jgi:hypothetical protein
VPTISKLGEAPHYSCNPGPIDFMIAKDLVKMCSDVSYESNEKNVGFFISKFLQYWDLNSMPCVY